jgi:type VI secretion system protein ImpF
MFATLWLVPMSRDNTPAVLLPSLIDRLIDPESGGTEAVRGYTIEQMTSAVRRDLEDLLNTRQTLEGVPEELREVRRSIAVFGLPDLVNLSAVTEQQRGEIGQLVERIINTFEPRLRQVRVTLVDPGDEKTRTVKFAVDARLRVDPSPEVAFDTLLELTTGHYSVQRRTGGP